MKRADNKSATRTQRDAYKSPFVSIRSYVTLFWTRFFFFFKTTFSISIDFDLDRVWRFFGSFKVLKKSMSSLKIDISWYEGGL